MTRMRKPFPTKKRRVVREKALVIADHRWWRSFPSNAAERELKERYIEAFMQECFLAEEKVHREFKPLLEAARLRHRCAA